MMSQGDEHNKQLLMGRISGVHGVKGWVKIHSHTEPREAIIAYSPWNVGQSRREMEPIEGGAHGKTVIAHLRGVHDRDAATALVGQDMWVDRSILPNPGEGHYYWADLVGLEVLLENGERLGVIESMMATGANDVMVIAGGDGEDRQRLIPFIEGDVVLGVDLDSGRIRVRWDRDF